MIVRNLFVVLGIACLFIGGIGVLRADAPGAVPLFVSFALWVGLAFLYLIPALVGATHHNATAIALLNVLLGWTVIGWIAALIWATTRPAPANAKE
jgi:hypothetical protein